MAQALIRFVSLSPSGGWGSDIPATEPPAHRASRIVRCGMAKKKTRGFEKNAQRIAQERGIPIERARKILAAATRGASPAAKRRNPRLKRVKGKAKRRRR